MPAGEKPGLNADQQQVCAWREGRLAVVAGPGTGKTRVLVERIRALMESSQTDILAVTFTTRAAREIAERLGDAAVEVCTFHSLAARILREAGIDFEVADEAMLEQVASPAIDPDVKTWVDDLLFRQGTARPLDREQSGLLAVLKSQGYYTYEGLIEEALRFMQTGTCTKRWNHVMVDEFQDINPLQYAFLEALSRDAASVMVIGDPHQAIYGFRGAAPRPSTISSGAIPGAAGSTWPPPTASAAPLPGPPTPSSGPTRSLSPAAVSLSASCARTGRTSSLPAKSRR